MNTIKASLVLAFGLATAGATYAATEIVIATVNNGHMIEMQKLTKWGAECERGSQRQCCFQFHGCLLKTCKG